MKSLYRQSGSPVQQLVENHTRDAGGGDNDIGNPVSPHFQEGCRRFAEQTKRIVNGIAKKTPKNDPDGLISKLNQLSLKEMLFAVCPQIDENSNAGQVAEAINLSSFPTISTLVINPTVLAAYMYDLDNADQLVTDYGDAKAADEVIAGFTSGIGLRRVYDGEQYPSDNIREKWVKIQTAQFGLMVDLTWAALRFDQTGQLLSRARAVGGRMGAHRHQYIVEKLQDVAITATGEAVNTSYRPKGVASTVFTSTHATVDNQTNDNTGSGAFSYANLQTLIIKLQKMVDEEGTVSPVKPAWILGPIALQQQILALVKSAGIYDTANRADNVVQFQFVSGGPKIFTSPVFDLSSSVKYYCGDPARGLIWLWTRRPETLVANTTSTEAVRSDIVQSVRVSYGGGCGYGDYRPVAQSTGA